MSINADSIKGMIRDSAAGINVDVIKDDEPLSEHGLDSLGIMNLFLYIEENHGIAIPDDDIDRLQSINDIVAYINQKS